MQLCQLNFLLWVRLALLFSPLIFKQIIVVPVQCSTLSSNQVKLIFWAIVQPVL